MEAKAEIMSKQIMKPSSPTSHLLRDFKLSFIDQIPAHYVSVVLFYSAQDINSFSADFSTLSSKLKASLSDVLSLYYPFCGRLKSNAYVECNDAGVIYMEARIRSTLTEILECPQVKVLRQFLPIDPHEPHAGYTNNEERVLMAIQVTELGCGAKGLGVCISHTIADGTTVASFLSAWGETAKASGSTTKPHMEASLLFPARDNFSSPLTSHPSYKENIVFMRLVFDGTSLSSLKAEMEGCNPTRVEAVTALIWKSMMEAAVKANSGEKNLVGTFATHMVNIRSRMFPPLPEHCMGNVCQLAVTEMVELQVDEIVELQDLAMMVRKAIRKFDADYMSTLISDAGFDLVMECLNHVIRTRSKGGIWYSFTSWARFPLYEVDFGWGKPTWVCSIGIHKANYIMLMPTRNGEGMEAWVSLNEKDVVEFERNPKILQYASLSTLSS